MSIRVGRKHEPGAQYIGRGSPLGNPYKIGVHGANREAVINMYRHWFAERIAERDPIVMAELRRLYRIARDGDLVLGCFCAPQPCHGDVIKEFLEFHLDFQGK